MQAPHDTTQPSAAPRLIAATGLDPFAVIQGDEFQEAFGEPLTKTLDLGTWRPGEDLAALYEQLEAQVKDAVAREAPMRETIRAEVFPRIAGRQGAPAGAGVYQARVSDVERVHHALLFNGGVEACDGTSVTHDTLAVTITQIGVCLVTYQGDSGSWVHRLYRRDLRQVTADPAEEALALIERRQRRGGTDQPDRGSQLTELGRRGIMSYAERAVLLERSVAPWRMGHGNPVPYELLTGSGSMELLVAALAVLQRLIGEHRKFIFVPSAAGERGLLTIGHALRPLEYAIVDTTTARMKEIVDRGHYGKEYKQLASDFVATVGPQLVVGIYRASAIGPPQIFYSHADHAHQAALVAMADGALQEHRGFPTLIDLADTVCRTTFGAGDFLDSVRLAYTDTGHPFRYLGERETRR
jgi:hypothetical protein